MCSRPRNPSQPADSATSCVRTMCGRCAGRWGPRNYAGLPKTFINDSEEPQQALLLVDLPREPLCGYATSSRRWNVVVLLIPSRRRDHLALGKKQRPKRLSNLFCSTKVIINGQVTKDRNTGKGQGISFASGVNLSSSVLVNCLPCYNVCVNEFHMKIHVFQNPLVDVKLWHT